MNTLVIVLVQDMKVNSVIYIVSFFNIQQFLLFIYNSFSPIYEFQQHTKYSNYYFSAATILTLRGSSYVSYRVYDWKDRSHSSANRISLQFKVSYQKLYYEQYKVICNYRSINY